MRLFSEIYTSLGITMPVFLMVVLGIVFRMTGIMKEELVKGLNRFVFQVALPVSIFFQLYQAEFRSTWDSGFLAFCFLATAAQICIGWFFSKRIHRVEDRMEFVQATYRSSTALLGLAYLQQAYDSASASALMMVGCVPLYNIAAVWLLEKGPDAKSAGLRATLRDIVRNPIIWSIVIGFVFSYFRIPLTTIGEKTVKNLAQIASPVGLMAMGASIRFSRLRDSRQAILWASAWKLLLFPAIFLPLAVLCGFRTEKLMAILIMVGSATTVAAYTMAKSMGNEGEVSAGAVMITTLGSAVTMTLWILVLRFGNLL